MGRTSECGLSRAVVGLPEGVMGDLSGLLHGLDPRSAGVGFALGLTVSLALMIGLKLGKLMLKLALFVAIASLFGGAYLGWR